jgi:hypothetical protein
MLTGPVVSGGCGVIASRYIVKNKPPARAARVCCATLCRIRANCNTDCSLRQFGESAGRERHVTADATVDSSSPAEKKDNSVLGVMRVTSERSAGADC